MTNTKTAEATSFKTLPVAQIKVHPKNPRHRAAADDELVASLKEHGLVQPLIVVPTANDYLLIAGHRRLAGLKKARIKEAPVVVRHDLDTEAKQLEAMLIENSSREDLTPIEEAEGYEQLTLLGYKQVAIARLTGRTPKTVSGRLRLLKLSKTTRDKLHKGQFSIDDAMAMFEFADDPDTTKKLEKAAAARDSWSFRSALAGAKRKKKAALVAAEHLALCTAAGLEEIPNPEGHSTWSFPGHRTLSRLENVNDVQKAVADEKKQHRNCLGYLVEDTSYSGRQGLLMCTDTATHADPNSEVYLAQEKARAEGEAARAQRSADQALSCRLRIETVLSPILTGPSLAPALAEIARGLLPSLISSLNDTSGPRELFQEGMGIPTDQRWGYVYSYNQDPDPRWVTFLEEIPTWSAAKVTTALFTALAASADHEFTLQHNFVAPAAAYVDLLEALEHEYSPIDQELADRVRPPVEAGAA